MASFGHYLGSTFGSTLGSTLDKINQVAGEVSGTVHNVAYTLEQTVRDNLRTHGGGHPGTNSGTPEVEASTAPHSTASSPVSTPDSEGGLIQQGLAQAQPSHAPSDPRTNDDMACDHCGFRFNMFQRKKQCSECFNYFCGNCLSPRRNTLPRTCAQCQVLSSQPPIRSDLMKLRVKDLRRYLNAKQINTTSCVEKKDLVELIIRENSPNVPHRSPSDQGLGYRSTETNTRMFLERQSSFPKSYTEGSHRPHWMSEDTPDPEVATGESSSDLVEDFVVIPSPSEESGPSSQEKPETERSSVEVVNPPQSESEVLPSAPVDVSEESSRLEEEPESHSSHVDQSSEPQSTPPLEGSREAIMPSSPHTPEGAQALLKPNVIESVSNSSTPSSPRRFAGRGLVYLSEIQSLDDLQELSVKQIKDILAMNRVTFKGVLEKNELLNILTRLWKQEQQLKSGKDVMVDDDLCKICMDDPVDCVMLECGHMCTCTQCGKQMAECPMCRQYVVRVVRTFKS